ncbi:MULTISPECIES: hypothetical protein [unclassified Pseudoalteromonas]
MLSSIGSKDAYTSVCCSLATDSCTSAADEAAEKPVAVTTQIGDK